MIKFNDGMDSPTFYLWVMPENFNIYDPQKSQQG